VTFAVLRALTVATWRERLLRPIFAVLCLMVALTDVTSARLMGELQDPALLLTLLIAGGSVGRDVTSGVLPLLFTRPLVRSRYVVAKWIASASAPALLSALTIGIEAIVLARAGQGVAGIEIADAIIKSVTLAFGISSVLVLFSTLVTGFADVFLWFILSALPSLAHKYIPQRFGDEWHAFFNPSIDWAATVGPPVGWFGLVSYVSTVTLCLGLAVVAINRKELSYASG
jgi:ABC-type transport system involved in multi-copper enzyme maturation permease subunit